MAKREIIKIDEERCNGCGLCIPGCPEGALQIIDGKAHLISDLFCDGLGACIGHCPEDAITIEEREAEPYDEKKTMVNIAQQGPNVIQAHLEHLRDHHQHEYLKQAMEYLKENNIETSFEPVAPKGMHGPTGGCPGAKVMDFSNKEKAGNGGGEGTTGPLPSELRQWPIQLHLIPPTTSYYQGKDVLLVADCVAYALGNFHQQYLKGKSLAIACPKLDEKQDIYVEKIKSWVDDAKINTLTVLIMQVPCCGGLFQLAQQGLERAERAIPVKAIVVSLEGDILSEEWVKA